MTALYPLRFNAEVLRPMGFGGTLTPAGPTFTGDAINKLEAIGGGRFKVGWNSAATGTIARYNIYVKATSGGSYPSVPFIVDNTLNQTVINFLNTDLDPLIDGTDYTVKVTAEDTDGNESANTDELNNISYGGSSYIQIRQAVI